MGHANWILCRGMNVRASTKTEKSALRRNGKCWKSRNLEIQKFQNFEIVKIFKPLKLLNPMETRRKTSLKIDHFSEVGNLEILKSKIFKILISWKFFSTLTFLSCAFLSLPDCSRSPWGMLIEFCAVVWTFGRRPRRKSQHWEEWKIFENLEIFKSKIFEKSKISRSPSHWNC